MGSIGQRIHLKDRESENKKIYLWIDIAQEKAQNIENRWSPLRGNKTDWVIDAKEFHQITLSNRGPTKTRKFLTIEGGWYRCGSL
ncbi:hypothetical protein Oscil6304_0083 [Oscillatoria acuminata PCC 6304]|uniref:Uncharacterized protein n=1 Tax=Oscillatoria acuminata PCC 6304 TaxID=56110 RepID=K9TCK7_9CYAN|nr:hypothetical protein Oscil6304_0083 [Oscillatoria acuminata PCC 6304]